MVVDAVLDERRRVGARPTTAGRWTRSRRRATRRPASASRCHAPSVGCSTRTDDLSLAARRPPTSRAGFVRWPRPRVAEPEGRQQMDRRVDRAAVVHGDEHADVVGCRFGVLDLDVEVAAVGEDAGVDQFVLGFEPRSLARSPGRAPRTGRRRAGTCTGIAGRRASAGCRRRSSTPSRPRRGCLRCW